MKLQYYIVIFLALTFCSNPSHEKVKVTIDKEILALGDTITIRLYVPFNKSIAPSFHIIIDKDTFNVALEEPENLNAKFKYVARSIGSKELDGYVTFLDNNKIKQTSFFKIRFLVKK